MGETVSYLGHVNLVPSLNQSEYDYLEAYFGLRSFTAGNRAEKQPDDWCGWGPCPHGCCLSWDGREKFHAGVVWMEYLIDHLLRPGARNQASADPRFAGFTFDHRLDGVIVGERSWSYELFAIRVTNNEVSEEILHRGDPLPGDPGWDGLYLEDRPWLAKDPHPRSSFDLPDPPASVSSGALVGLSALETKRRRRKSDPSLG